MEKLQRLPFKARKAVFEKLEQIVDIAAMSKEDRMKYDESIKVYRDQLVTMEDNLLWGCPYSFFESLVRIKEKRLSLSWINRKYA